MQEPDNLAMSNLISRLPLFSYQTLQISCSSPSGPVSWKEVVEATGVVSWRISRVANRSTSEDVRGHTNRLTVENTIRLNVADLAQLNFKGASRLLKKKKKTLVMSSLLLGDNLGPSVYRVLALYGRHRGDFMSHGCIFSLFFCRRESKDVKLKQEGSCGVKSRT